MSQTFFDLIDDDDSPIEEERARAVVAALPLADAEAALRDVFERGFVAQLQHTNLTAALVRALAVSPDEGAQRCLAALIDGDGDLLLRTFAAEQAFGHPHDPAPGRVVLDVLAAHAEHPDPLFGWAILARFVRGDADMVDLLAAELAASPSAGLVAQRLPFDRLPLTVELLEVLHPTLPFVGPLLVEPLVNRAAPELILDLLELGVDKALAVDLLPGLRVRGTAEHAPRLRTLSGSARYRGNLGRLMEKLAADLAEDREAAPAPAVKASVSTDGGPVLLLPGALLETWTSSSDDDYAAACDIQGLGVLERDGGSILVAETDGAWVTSDPNALCVILAGTPELLGLLGGSLRYQRLEVVMDSSRGGLWLHDAAAAGEEREGSVLLDVPAGPVRLWEARLDDERGFLWSLRVESHSLEAETLPPALEGDQSSDAGYR